MKPLLLAIPGIVFIAWSLIDQTDQFFGFFIIGIELIIIGIVLVLIAKPTYAVHIERVSGDHSILRSTDLTFIQRIVDAMSHAIKYGER